MIWLILFPFYYALILLICIIVSLNKAKLRRKYKVESILIYMFLYLINVVYNLVLMNLGVISLILTTIGILYIIVKSGKTRVIGLTGGIGCGKSTVSKLLNEQFRIPLIDCDKLARVVVEVDKPAYKQIVQIFGNEVIDPITKEIDRPKLGQIVFNNESLRRKLTALTGKYIMIEIIKGIYNAITKNQPYVLLDAPLLYESKYLPYLCYPCMVVYISEPSVQVKRIVDRDGMTIEEAQQRIKSQMPMGLKLKMADVKLVNDGTVDELRSLVIKELANYVS